MSLEVRGTRLRRAHAVLSAALAASASRRARAIPSADASCSSCSTSPGVRTRRVNRASACRCRAGASLGERSRKSSRIGMPSAAPKSMPSSGDSHGQDDVGKPFEAAMGEGDAAAQTRATVALALAQALGKLHRLADDTGGAEVLRHFQKHRIERPGPQEREHQPGVHGPREESRAHGRSRRRVLSIPARSGRSRRRGACTARRSSRSKSRGTRGTPGSSARCAWRPLRRSWA